MVRIYDRINIFKSNLKFNEEVGRGDDEIAHLKQGKYVYVNSTFCREKLINSLEGLLKEERALYDKGIVLYTTIVLKYSIRGWTNEDLHLLNENIVLKLFSLEHCNEFMNLKYVDYEDGSAASKPGCLAWSLKRDLLLNPTFSTEKASLIAFILENEETSRAMLEDGWSTKICNLLIKIDKEKPLYMYGFLWSAIYLHMLTTRPILSLKSSSGPASSAKQLFKTEDLISFITKIEDKDYVAEALTDKRVIYNKMFEETILGALRKVGKVY
jgi:hypothetical protein